MSNRWRIRSLPLLVALAVLAAACGDDDTVTTGNGAPPPGAAEVAVQVIVDGGFVPVQVALRTIPTVTILSDGTVITPALVPMIYPGPAIAPLQAGTITADELAALLDRARDDGLLDEPLDFGSPPVADLPTTRVTISADGRTVQHEAYALEEDSGVEPDQAANRRLLRDFVAAVTDAAVGDRLWTPSAVAATVAGPYTGDPTIDTPEPMDWPLATPPETDGDFPCTLVEGDDVDTLLAALADANELTPWVIDGEQYSVVFRPIVPGAPGCE